MGKSLEAKKKKFIAASVATAAVATVVAPALTEGKTFTDITPSVSGYEEVMGLSKAGIIDGYADGTFKPYQTITRGQTAIMLAKALNLLAAPNAKQFKDVSKNSPYFNAVSAVMQAGIIKGYGDEFKPQETLTREEMASIMVRAFKLSGKTHAKVPFTDLAAVSPTHRENVKILYQNGLTKGKDGKTYAPKESVTRVQFSLFLYRQLQGILPETIQSISGDKVTINGVSYSYASELKELFSESNQHILKNAKIKFTKTNNSIEKITYLEITASGKAAVKGEKEFSQNAQLEGKVEIAGDVRIRGNYITLKNLTITGNLYIEKELQNDFYSEGLIVKGKTIINGGDDNTVVFKDANLQQVEVNKKGVRVEALGTTIIKSVNVTNDASIIGSSIPEMHITGNAQKVELEAEVKNLTIEAKDNLELTGKPNLTTVNVKSVKELALNLTGQIDTLKIESAEKVTINPDLKIGELTLPEGKGPAAIIANYDSVKTNIQTINGKANPDAQGPIVIAPPSNDGVLPTETIEKNILDGGQEYNKNYVINPSEAKVFGAEIAGINAIVKGNVTVKGTIELKNLTINGTLYLDPGDQGEVTLSNVDAARIEVLSGETGTIKFSGVNSPAVIVKDQNGVKLETDGSSTIGNLELAPENGSEVQLAGNFNETNILITKETMMTAKEGFVASSLEINVANPNSEVKLNAEAPVEFPAINVNSAIKLKSESTNISASLINVNVKESNQTVELNGPLGNPEIIVEKPITLSVESTVSKVTAKANISLEGSKAASIEQLETVATEGQPVTINSENQEIQNALDTKKAQSIQLAKTKIEELIGQSNPSLNMIQEADALVKTAMSLGAVKADLQSGGINLFEKLEVLKADVQEKLAAIKVLSEKLLALPKPEKLNSYTELSIARLEKAVNAAKEAKEKVIKLGIDPSTVSNYDRLAAAEARIQELRTSYEQAKAAAISALQALPEVSSIKVESLEAAKTAVSNANSAIATAKRKGVKDTEFVVNNINLLAKLAEVSNTIKAVEAAHNAAKKAALTEAINKIALIPANNQITFQNLDSVREKVIAARTAVEAALEIGVTAEEITNISLLVDVELRVKELGDARNTAIAAANEAIAQLPAASTITLANIDDVKTKLASAELAVASAEEKGAKDTDFADLEKLTAVKERISSLEKGKQTAIQEAVTALNQIPKAEEITETNFKEAKEKMKFAKEKVAVAKVLGAKDSELTGLENIAPAEAKIASLEEALMESVSEANKKISDIPTADKITFENYKEVAAKVAEAKEAVESAFQKGATEADLKDINKIQDAEAKLAQLEAEKKAAISAANQALAEVPAASTIKYENIKSAEEKVAAAEAAVATARAKGAVDGDFNELSKITEAKIVITGLKKELNDAIAAANAALAEIPAADTITIQNYKETEEKVKAAEAAIESARAKGAADTEFIGLVKLTEAKTKIDALLKALSDAIAAANTALNVVPAADEITFQNYKEVNEKIAAAEDAIQAAKAKGAVDTDFTGLVKIETTKNKIAALLKELDDAIIAANTSLADVPEANTITFDNYKAAENKVSAAESAVETARTKGAVDKDFTGLTRLNEAKTKIAALMKELSDAITEANAALTEVPAADTITIQNYKAAEEKITAAEEAVEAARVKGATEADFTGYAKIEAAKARISVLLKALADAITSANAAIQALPDPTTITAINIDDAIIKVEAAKKAVQSAREKGAVDADFNDIENIALVEAKINEFGDMKEKAIKAANDALELIPEVGAINEENVLKIRGLIQHAQLLVAEAKSKGAVDTDFINLDKLAAAVEKLKEFEVDYELPYWNNPLEALDRINQNIDAFTPQDLADTLQYYFIQGLFEEYKEALKNLKATKGQDLTLTDIEEIVIELDIQFENEALQVINDDPAAMTLEDLEKIMPWVTLENFDLDLSDIQAKVASLKETRGAVSYNDISDIIDELRLTKAENELQEQKANVSLEFIHYIASQHYINAYPFLADAYKEKMEQHVAGNGTLTPEVLVQIITQVNTAAANSARDTVISNPSALTFEDLQILEFFMAEYALVVQYREALVIQKESTGELTMSIINQVIENVNREAYLDQINADGELYYSLFSLFSDIFDLTLFAEYTEAINAALTNGELSYEALEEIIENVNLSKEEKLLVYINANPQKITMANLMALSLHAYYLDALALQDYRNAIEEAIVDKNRPLTALEISQIINEINAKHTLEALNTNPETVPAEHLRFLLDVHYFDILWDRYLQALKAEFDAGRNITIESLNEIIDTVNAEAADEYLAKIIANPNELTIATMYIAFPNFWVKYELLDEYRKGIEELKKSIVSPTRADIQQLINDITEADRQKKEEEILILLNENPEFITWDLLNEIGIYMEEKLFRNYKEEFIEQKEQGVNFTYEKVSEIIADVHLEYGLSRINGNPETLELWEIFLVSHEVSEAYLADYINAFVLAQQHLTLEEAVATIQEVNKQKALNKIETAPATLTFEDLGRLYGWNVAKYEHRNEYLEEIKLVVSTEEKLTLESLEELLIRVNNRAIQDALKDINDNPLTFNIESLRILLQLYINEEWLEFYREAINTARNNGVLTVEQLEMIIEQVNQQGYELDRQRALKHILENPETFTTKDLNRAGFGWMANDYGQYINRFRDAIKEKVQIEGTNLSYDVVYQLLKKEVEEIRLDLITEALDLINSDLQNVTFENLKAISDIAREPYFNSYIQELEKNAEAGAFTLEQIRELIREVTKREALSSINSGAQITDRILYDTLMDEGFWYYYEHESFYQEALAFEIEQNGPLTVEDIITVITKVNEDKGLEHILANLMTFNYFDLRKVTGFPDIDSAYFDVYKAALLEYYDLNGTLTVEGIKEIVIVMNEKVLLLRIQQDPYSIGLFEIQQILGDPNGEWVKSELDDKYKQAIMEFVNNLPEGETLTVEDLKSIILGVSEAHEQQLLDAVNKNLSGFERHHLKDLIYYFDLDVTLWAEIGFYRSAVQEMYAILQHDLTIVDIVEAIDNGNVVAEKALLDAINNRLADFDVNDLYALFQHFEIDLELDWHGIDLYRSEILKKHEELKRDLTTAEIIEAVKEANTAIDQSKLDVINNNLLEFDYEALKSVIDATLAGAKLAYDDLEYYRIAIIEMHEKSGDLTAEQITQAVITGVSKAIQAAFDAINSEEFEIKNLYKVLGEDTEIIWQNHDFYKKAVKELRAKLGRDLTKEEVKQAVIDGNLAADSYYLDMINNNPNNVSAFEFQTILGNDLKILGARLGMYYSAILEQKEKSGESLNKEEMISVVEAVNQQLKSNIIDAINNNPEALTIDQLMDSTLLYDTWIKDERLRIFQIYFINHKASGGTALSEEEIASRMMEIEERHAYSLIYAFVNPQTSYQVGELVNVEIPYYYGNLFVYLVPKTSDPITTVEELEILVNDGLGIKKFDNETDGDLQLDTSGLSVGDYVAYAVRGNGQVSIPSNAFILEGKAADQPEDPNEPQDPEQPDDPQDPGDPGQPVPPPSAGSTVAMMEINYSSGTEVVVTVTDADQNFDTEALDSIEVVVENLEGDYISVNLKETDHTTGVFTGKFSFGDKSIDDTDTIAAMHSQHVIIGYFDNGDEDLPSVTKKVTYLVD